MDSPQWASFGQTYNEPGALSLKDGLSLLLSDIRVLRVSVASFLPEPSGGGLGDSIRRDCASVS